MPRSMTLDFQIQDILHDSIQTCSNVKEMGKLLLALRTRHTINFQVSLQSLWE